MTNDARRGRMPGVADALLGYSDVAAMTGLSTATLRSYRAAGRFPEPDELPVPDRPRWRESTITAWLENRPGMGAPGRKRRPRK